MSSMFKPAVRHQLKGRIAIDGPSGSGKTFTALRLATALADGGRIAVVNTESGAIQKYLGLSPDGAPWEFDVCELTNFAPTAYTEAIVEAGKAGYDILLIDSLSHAWEGEGGALEQVTKAQDRAKNSFTAWKDVTPQHNRMIQAILKSPCHVIATMRSKTEYVLETNDQGKCVPRKVGMAPVQRAGMEYEFDLYCSMDWDHVLRVTKSRCPELDGIISVKPSANSFLPFVGWLKDGTAVPDGYYSANESDFRKIEQTKIAAINGKPLSAIEKAKELAASKAEVQQLKEQSVQVAEPTAKPEQSGQEGSSLKEVYSVATSEPCTETQIQEIKEAIVEAAQTGVADMAKKVKQRLEQSGIGKLANLSIGDADLLLDAIRLKNLEKFFERSLDPNDIPF